ncbi:MAG: SsrA-binding protein SmpB [bacterium]|nr:SsrA-binding protein SmpB [Coprothermobacterota bacterium]
MNDDIKVVSVNRRALHNYEILEKLEAGLALHGSEVKAIREGRINFLDSYVRVDQGEAYLWNLHIGNYRPAVHFAHEATRKRKLLLHKSEIRRLGSKAIEKGLTIIPLRMYFRQHRIKLEIALARGKREYDKREAIRKKEERRVMADAMKVKLRRV